MCPSGGMADAAVSKTVVSRRASSTLASGTSLSICKAALWVAFFVLCQKKTQRSRPCRSNAGDARNHPAGAQAAMATDASCAKRRSSPLAPAQLSALSTVGQHEKRRGAPHARGTPLRRRCRKKTKRYSAFAAFCFFAVETIVFTPLTASTIASTNSSTARIACSTGASAMPLVMMVVTFW